VTSSTGISNCSHSWLAFYHVRQGFATPSRTMPRSSRSRRFCLAVKHHAQAESSSPNRCGFAGPATGNCGQLRITLASPSDGSKMKHLGHRIF
jgi:hypothetical protein